MIWLSIAFSEVEPEPVALVPDVVSDDVDDDELLLSGASGAGPGGGPGGGPDGRPDGSAPDVASLFWVPEFCCRSLRNDDSSPVRSDVVLLVPVALPLVPVSVLAEAVLLVVLPALLVLSACRLVSSDCTSEISFEVAVS